MGKPHMMTAPLVFVLFVVAQVNSQACINQIGDSACNTYASFGDLYCKNLLWGGWLKQNCYKACGHCTAAGPTWSEWTPYTSCNPTCGPGTKSRSRTCSGGTGCVGEPLETVSCQAGVCASSSTWNDWGNWAGCSVTCGGGTSKRTRTCSGGNGQCPGFSEETQACKSNLCPVWGNWSAWVCSVTCGSGTETRNRDCANGNPGDIGCEGSAKETRPCSLAICPVWRMKSRSGKWHPWTSWSCSVTCGRGKRVRTRKCQTSSCRGPRKQIRRCSVNNCAKNTVNPWSDWTACQPTCGQGFKTRARSCGPTCTQTEGQQCQNTANCQCPAAPCVDSGFCFASFCFFYQHNGCQKTCGTCPTSQSCVAAWDDWSGWTVCSKVCGSGERKRFRGCNKVTGVCSGNYEQTEDCNVTPCSGGGASWGEWGNYGTCTLTCGGGTKSRSRTCNNGNPGDVGCEGSATDQTSCNIQACPRWEDWGGWSSCSKLCGTGSQERERSCLNGPGCPGSNTETQSCNPSPCIVTSWSDWGNFGACSTSCGIGTKSRTRTCNNGNPGDVGCAGSATDQQTCNPQACPFWSNWGDFAACTELCGGGTKTRTRTCNNGNPGDVGCLGSTSNRQACNEQACAVTSWSDWSPFQGCSKTCGGGTRSRSRTCNNGNPGDPGCPGSAAEQSSCNPQTCPFWSNWSDYGGCSKTCGGGTRSRTRTCNNGNPGDVGCEGSATEQRQCNSQNCPVWSNWSGFGGCTKTCGGGTRSRTRTCNNGSPGVPGCEGSTTDQQTCNAQNCPVWSNWGDFAACTELCGGGTKTRTRTCNNGNPGDVGCLGSTSNRQACNEQACAVTSWSEWNPFGACSKSCEGGTRSRSRTCSNGNPGDVGCEGSATGNEDCNPQACPIWGEWASIGPCTEPCGGGTEPRRRTCINGNPGDPGCPGLATGSISCNAQPCPVTSWNVWNTWASCTKTCGGGTRSRSRTCNNGNPGDAGCEGGATENEVCNGQTCPVWSDWTTWTSCTKTCGGGTRPRIRTCNNGNPGDVGCEGSATGQESCNGQTCPVWSDWTTWTSCTKTCGGGTRSKTRTCNNGNPGDVGCEGSANGQEPCNPQACEVTSWSDWSTWTTCTKTCGIGTTSKTRTCNNGNPGEAGCFGGISQNKVCNQQDCPVWGDWNTWTSCTKTCGGGSRSRARPCSNGNPGDVGCVGSATENENCNAQACPVWNNWTSFGDCSKTCGGGTKSRTRTCNNGSPGDVGCEGVTTDQQTCNAQACPGAGWGSWTGWGACSATCGRGTHRRTRVCGSSACQGFDYDEKDCLHPTVCPCATSGSGGACIDSYPTYCQQEVAQCNGQYKASFFEIYCKKSCNFCVICGTWSAWSSWTGCSKTCDSGSQRRSRTCPTDTKCLGDTESFRTCSNLAVCPTEWSVWGDWGPCSVTCGTGTRARNRVCSKTGCVGQSQESGSCYSICDLPGESWSKCSRTCGDGTRYRKRTVSGVETREYEDCLIIACPQSVCVAPRYVTRYSVRSYSCCDLDAAEPGLTCGNNANTGRIVGGRDAKARQWPWVAQITFVKNNQKNLCGGNLINNKWVLSAAHCFQGIATSSIYIIFGGLLYQDRAVHVQNRTVDLVKLHSNYQFPVNDIALLRLKTPVLIGTYVRPICLPKGEEAVEDTMCIAAGWGILAVNTDISQRLLEVDLRILNITICNNGYSRSDSNDKHICAGRIAGGVDTCSGDSGGPLMCQRCASCRWFVAGLTSFGDRNCGIQGRPGMYTRVSYYNDWINQVTGTTIASGTLPSC